MENPDDRTFRLSSRTGREYLDEGFCHHCGIFVQFRTPSLFQIRVDYALDEGEVRREYHEDYFAGICTRQSCRRTTVVRRLAFVQYYRGDPDDHTVVEEDVVYPHRRSARKPLSAEVPEGLRKAFDEAAATEYLSATACGFLAGRILEQALRDRLLKDANDDPTRKKELRRTQLGGLIRQFAEAGHATGEVHELIVLLQGFRNFAAHPPQLDDAEDLDIDGPQASFLLNAARELLEHIYVRPARLAEMKKQLEQKRRGDAVAHGLEFRVTDEPRQPGLPPQEVTDDDVPF